MARAQGYSAVIDDFGNAIKNRAITYLERDGVTPLAQAVYAAESGGSPEIAPQTNSLGVANYYVETAQRAMFTVDDVAGTFYVDFVPDWAALLTTDSAQTVTGAKTFTEPVLIEDGTVLAPGLGFATAPTSGLRMATGDGPALVIDGVDAIRTRTTILGTEVNIGNVGFIGAAQVPFHVHYQTTAANDGIIGGHFEVTNNASLSITNPFPLSGGPDSAAATLVVYQTEATAQGAMRALEAHAVRGHADAGDESINWTVMGAEIGVHSVAAGNAAFTGLDSNPPKSIGIYLVSNDAAFATGTVRADAGLYIHGGSGFKWPILGRDTDGSPLFGVNQRGNFFGGAGGSNAAETTYGFYENVTGGAKGMFDAGDNMIAWSISGVERIRLDANGLGIGTTPVASHRLKTSGGDVQILSGGATTNVQLELGRTGIDGALAVVGVAGQIAGTSQVGDVVLRAEDTLRVILGSNGQTSIIVGETGDAPTLGFFGVTPVVRPTALTQTYATSDATHAAPTSATLTNNTGGSVSTTLAAITGGGAGCENATKNAVASLADQVNKLRVDLIDLKDFVNAAVDQLQSLGALQ
jgi:hypothetical protein